MAQRRAEKARAEFRRQDAVQKVSSEVVRALADYRKAREQALLYKTGIIPQANLTVASMMAGYQVSKVDFLNLIRAQITLYNYETQYWKALTGARQRDYRAGRFAYRDVHFGLARFSGQETVALDDRVIWSLVYCGGVAPGVIDIAATHAALGESIIKEWIRKTPLRRLGQPNAVVTAIIFAIENDFLTGRTVQVDGGVVL